MTLWYVSYSCYEDWGIYGYFSTEERAKQVCADKLSDIGKITVGGDTIHRVGIGTIEVDGPLMDPTVETLNEET